MKKLVYSIMALVWALSLTSCFDDDSSLGSNAVGDITISGMEESYANTAYMNEQLNITPEVKSAENVTYEWLLLSDKTGTKDEQGNQIQPTVIGTEKDLHYEVNLAPGVYQLRLVVKGESGYEVYKTATFTVRTTFFSQAFYILKENTEGNTDVDLYTLDGKKGQDIIATMDGAALEGKPVALSPLYQAGYVNPDDDKMTSANTMAISTDKGVFCQRRTTDFKTIFDRSNIKFDPLDKSENVYGFFGGMFRNAMITNKGICEATKGGNDNTTGQYGNPVSACGGSRYFLVDLSAFCGGALWDEVSHSLKGFNYNFNASPLLKDDMSGDDITQNLTSYDCLFCGYNLMNSTGTGAFVLRDQTTSKRYLYLTSGSIMSGATLSDRKLLADGSHMAQASYYACCGISASYIYCVDGGHLYACNFKNADLTEVELKPKGIAEGEIITFVSNQFWNPYMSSGDPFDYLIVGTQKGNTYKLYFYQTNGGAPIDEPVHVMEGKGKVKCIRLMNDGYNAFDSQLSNLTYNNCD